MRVLITGAAGFVGTALLQQLLEHGIAGQAISSVVAADLQATHVHDPRVKLVIGSLVDPKVLAQLVHSAPDVVFHLASVPGGAAEAQPELGRTVNLEATLALFHGLENTTKAPRIVFASTVAVFGSSLPAVVDDHTVVTPALSYGAHKLMAEIALADAVRCGRLSGCSLRLPGVVARPGDGAGLLSAFMSQLFWCARDERPLSVPVHAIGTAWWLSAQQCARNLRHAAGLPEEQLQSLGRRRVALMPALHLSVEQVVAALSTHFQRDCASLFQYEAIEHIQQLFAQYPPLHTPLAHQLGLQHDGDALGLVNAVLNSSDF